MFSNPEAGVTEGAGGGEEVTPISKSRWKRLFKNGLFVCKRTFVVRFN